MILSSALTKRVLGLREAGQRYRRLYGPYTVEVSGGLVQVWRHSWRRGVDQVYDYSRNLREVKFPSEFRAERLPR